MYKFIVNAANFEETVEAIVIANIEASNYDPRYYDSSDIKKARLANNALEKIVGHVEVLGYCPSSLFQPIMRKHGLRLRGIQKDSLKQKLDKFFMIDLSTVLSKCEFKQVFPNAEIIRTAA